MIGKLDQRVTLERKTLTADGIGGTTAAWANVPSNATVWANVKAKAGREGMDNGRTTATFVSVFTIRNRADLLPQDRIVWGGVTYNIRAFLSEGARQQCLAIEAERGVAS